MHTQFLLLVSATRNNFIPNFAAEKTRKQARRHSRRSFLGFCWVHNMLATEAKPEEGFLLQEK
jgi:hypothetical protein